MATETKTFYPGANEGGNGVTVSNAANPVGKGSSNSTYATISPNDGEGYCFWPFDVSVIPADAEIVSVSCKAKASLSSATNAYGEIQLYSGNTAKGSLTEVTTASATTYSLSAGTWTRSELESIRLRTYIDALRGSSFRFFGADLTVQYTYQSEKFMLRLGGAWHDVARVFKRASGIWVEQTELANAIEDGVRYQNGGEYVAPVKPAAVTITGTGNSTYCYATINGTKYNSATSNIEVMPGDVITFGVYGRSSTYYGRVTIDGTQALNVTNQQTQTYNWTVPDGVKTISIAMTYSSSTYQRNGRIVVTTT